MNRLYTFFLFCSALVYLCTLVSPASFSLAGLAVFLIPVLLILHGVLFVWILITRRKLLIYACIGLLMGIPYYSRSFSWDQEGQKENTYSVLSYNVRVFNVYKHLNTNFVSSKKMIEWVLSDDSDIKCLQEFHNQNESTVFNTSDRITRGSRIYKFISPFTFNQRGHEFGLAIFSKFPIINTGEVAFTKSRQNNRAIYADIKILNDTVRVYNAHLESMSIDQQKVFNTTAINEGIYHLYERLSYGTVIRAMQIQELTQHMDDCQYPIIMCSDLNELPYSYVYQELSSRFQNAFEEKGKGFGFSYNGKVPFLRIDNQFYSNSLSAVDYENIRKVNYSDHFPVKVWYDLPE